MLPRSVSHDRSSETSESYFSVEYTLFLNSRAHPYGSDNIFPLELLLYFSPPSAVTSRGQEREGGGGEVDLHVSTFIQTERQACREALGVSGAF